MSVNPVIKSGTFKGWQFIYTGGHCTALYRPFKTGYWMVTDLQGIAVPGPRARRVVLGIYDTEGACANDWETTPRAALDIVRVLEGFDRPEAYAPAWSEGR